MLEEIKNLLENIIIMLKLSLNMDFQLNWFNIKDSQNFFVAVNGIAGFGCNAIIVDCCKGKMILHINLFDIYLHSQYLKYDVSNIEDVINLINKHLQDIVDTYRNLVNF